MRVVNTAECYPCGMARDSKAKAIQHTDEYGLINGANHTSSATKHANEDGAISEVNRTSLLSKSSRTEALGSLRVRMDGTIRGPSMRAQCHWTLSLFYR